MPRERERGKRPGPLTTGPLTTGPLTTGPLTLPSPQRGEGFDQRRASLAKAGR